MKVKEAKIPCVDACEPGEFLDPATGEVRGAPDTGVPGLLPIGGRGEFIIPPAPGTGEDMGKEVAGEPGWFGLGTAPGGGPAPRGPD